MAAKADCCCCSDCGVPSDVPLCCPCVCDQLCIQIVGAGSLGDCEVGDCNCTSANALFNWDATTCAWSGTITCGNAAIDLKFELKVCDGECKLCLTSSCLDLDGSCPTGTGTGSDPTTGPCQQFTPGNKEGNCGKVIKDCDQSSGFSATWDVDSLGCLVGNGPGTSTGSDVCALTITATCTSRVNPAKTGVDRICNDCDCVCKFICISYQENNCFGYKRVPWEALGTGTGSGDENGQWQATFTCPGDDQTVSVFIVRDSDGCCRWRVEVSRGTVTTDDIKTNCPDIDNLSWSVDLPTTGTGTDNATVTISCAPCDTCTQNVCCCADEDTDLPTQLTATIHDLNECSCADGLEVVLDLVSIETAPGGEKGGIWRGQATFCTDPSTGTGTSFNECTIDIAVICDAPGCEWELQYCLDGPGCSPGSCPDPTSGDLPGTTMPPGDCNGLGANECCNPLFLPFASGTDDCCCNPSSPASDFCIIITE